MSNKLLLKKKRIIFDSTTNEKSSEEMNINKEEIIENKEEIIENKSEELINNKPRFPFNRNRKKRLQLTNNQSTGILKKNLIIRPAYGLGNRLRAIASCYSICKSLGLNLIINWVPDHHCNCDMHDLFEEIGMFGYVVNEEIIIENLEKEGYKFYNYIESEPNGIC